MRGKCKEATWANGINQNGRKKRARQETSWREEDMKTRLFAVTDHHIRNLRVAAFAAVAGGLLALFGSMPVHAAVLTAGSSNPPFGGTVCADVNGGSLTSGTKVQAYNCSAGPNQQFQIIGYAIYTVGGQRCLDVLDAGTAAGTKVDSYTCDGTAAQQWYYYNGQIVNLNTDYCLDATTEAKGTQLVINPCSGASSQNWQIK